MANIAGRYVLGSSALIAFLWDEPRAQMDEDILVEEDAEVFMSAVNLGETWERLCTLCIGWPGTSCRRS